MGLISDTHSLIRPQALAALAGSTLILHAGDVGGATVLAELGKIAPVRAVLGNVDPVDGTLPEHVHVTLDGVRVHVSHGHELGSPTPARLFARYDADVIVYGHTHRPLVEWQGHRVVINPGAAGPARFSVKPTIARLRLTNRRPEVEIVSLADL